MPTFLAAVPGIAKAVTGILGKVIGDKEQRDEAEAEINTILATHFGALEETYWREIDARMEILKAELQQGDAYTKRARPSIIYGGLAVALLSALAAKVVGSYAVWRMVSGALSPEQAQALTEAATTILAVDGLQPAFWTAWGGVAASWVIGRTRERVGAEPGKLLSMVYGRSAGE